MALGCRLSEGSRPFSLAKEPLSAAQALLVSERKLVPPLAESFYPLSSLETEPQLRAAGTSSSHSSAINQKNDCS